MSRVPFLVKTLAAILIVTSTGSAQIGGGFGGVGGFGGGGNAAGGGANGGAGQGTNQNSAGIKIDPQGVLSLTVANDGSGLLDKKRREAIAKKFLSQDVNQPSKLRCVSLVELEKQLESTLSKEQPLTAEMFYFAGLQRIDHIFVFPDEQDVVIAGRAEGFTPDAVGRMVGVESGRPTLRLDDFVIAMRTVGKARQVGCSIDPVPQRLADLQKFISQGGPASVQEVEERFNQMDDILGMQTVRIDGVPPDSHFATMLVEADYRMKRVAIGLETPAVKGMRSHLAMIGPGGNTIQRWWFIPCYDSIARSEDGLAFQINGQRAQLLTQEEVSDAAGNRSNAPTTKVSIQAFAKRFTEKFPQLADKSPVFGELQNLIDWTMVAALLNKEQIAQRIGWKQTLFLDESRLKYPVFEVPKMVPSQVNYKLSGNVVIGLVCGGVVIHPQQAYDSVSAKARNSADLNAIRSSASTAVRNESRRWWWDLSN